MSFILAKLFNFSACFFISVVITQHNTMSKSTSDILGLVSSNPYSLTFNQYFFEFFSQLGEMLQSFALPLESFKHDNCQSNEYLKTIGKIGKNDLRVPLLIPSNQNTQADDFFHKADIHSDEFLTQLENSNKSSSSGDVHVHHIIPYRVFKKVLCDEFQNKMTNGLNFSITLVT